MGCCKSNNTYQGFDDMQRTDDKKALKKQPKI